MTITVTLKAVSCGTERTVERAEVPDMIPLESCYLGWPERLRNWLQLVETEINQ